LAFLEVSHTTIYRYSRPVRFGDHRLMLRPRDSHDLRLIQTDLNISPPASTCWHHDVFGNSVAIASFNEPGSELRIESNLRLETYATQGPMLQIAPEARSYPFDYSVDNRIDLGRMAEQQNQDSDDRLRSWAYNRGQKVSAYWVAFLMALDIHANAAHGLVIIGRRSWAPMTERPMVLPPASEEHEMWISLFSIS
jgi:hypothetical protein